ncbi:Chondroitinase-AC [Purpureocillium lavendulum]|uniref:Chondroitinase-AC n=1 Tax=Purpureocillium lavendulum TaxID=1247861 RepID=A0AB34FP79_9HYPO|nr:Chondroitinase-AC [Purpureocillium lavendulum]
MSLPDPRRIVTGHDEAGNAVFVADCEVPMAPTPVECDFAVLYETHQFPASNDVWEDPILMRTKSLANDKGIVLRCVDFRPNTKTLFHRTESLDFGIVFSGEIVCYLDNGVELTLKAGDVCVQRGTIHGWDNRTDKVARVYFVLSDFEIEGILPHLYTPVSHQHGSGYHAELIRLVSIWTSACQTAQDDRIETHLKLLHIQELDKKLATWRANLPATFDLESPDGLSRRAVARAISLNILYHQIMAALHSSIVPLFSLTPVAAEACGYFQTASAQTALIHARQISSIFLKWGFCSLPKAPVSTNLKAMHSIGKHWKLVSALTEFVPLLYNYHKSMAYSLADEPTALKENDLNRHKGVKVRAKVSILGHNAIIWNRGTVIDPGESPALDLDVGEKEGNEPENCSPGDGMADLGPANEELDTQALIPAMVDAFAAYQEGIYLVPQSFFHMSDSTVYCATDSFGFDSVFGQEDTRL